MTHALRAPGLPRAALFACLAISAAVHAGETPAAPAKVPGKSSPADAVKAEQLARGKYLVTTAGCHDCHTPLIMTPNGPDRDWSRMLSGHPESLVITEAPKMPAGGPWLFAAAGTTTAHAGPWGVSFTANLTPDPDTGLGKWTFQNFKDTIRTGRHMGRGRPVLPPMPIPMYKHFTDEDLGLIFGYLQSIPAVKNRVPEPLPPPEPMQAPAAH
jgi:mono/diheme cytochrome c family protein